MTECWLDSGIRDGRIGRPPASPSPGTTTSSIGPKRSTIAGETKANVDDLRQAGPCQRLADGVAQPSGECR